MESVTVLWSVSAAAAIVLAVLCGLMWLVERREIAALMLCVLGVATAASAYAELGMMHSATPEEYGAWLRWYHLPVYVALIAQILFVHFYLRTSRIWLMWAVIAARSFVLVVNFAVELNFNFSTIVSLRSASLLGEQISAIGAAVPRGWQWFAVASLFLLMAYLIDATVRRWVKGGQDSRRRAIAVSLALGLPMLCTVVYTQLLVFGMFRGPISNIPWFLGALSMMAYVSGREFVLSRRARLELAELRGQLAQIERVNLLGQLASALAHELSQPLTAISLNLAAARKQLKRVPPDVSEINSILDDIGMDDRRAVEIIDRMRQLFKQRAIELNPIKIEDVVRDAVTLVSAEANSKKVIMQWLIQPGLPPVFGDRVHLSQVLLNLLMNSIHAVQSRPIDARFIVVDARANEVTDEVEIGVQDSGPGIPGTIVNEIFKPLFTTKPEGMGMGLALCHTIIEAHGGRLWADNLNQQEGAVFRFTLRRVALATAGGAWDGR
jgi:signal transduction histidine kinase